MSDVKDSYYLQKALKLAKKGLGFTYPNPMVGAVLVKNGKIIGEGYHKKAGEAHGEIEALKSVTQDPTGATIYITLEPCSNYGKTPPCVEAIINAGIKKVICCTLDPNPVNHKISVEKLRGAGIEFETGICQIEARELNEIFFDFHEKQRPFIALKFAASLDGKIATGTFDSQWITNEKARTYARELRSQYQSVLVGINTVLKDDPHLGARRKGKKDPLRIILDSSLKIPLQSQVLRDNNIIIAATSKADNEKKDILEKRGINILSFDGNQIPLFELLKELVKREITNIFVEGGSQVLGSFVDAKLVDKIYIFHAPIIIGGEKGVSAIGGTGAKTVKDAMQLDRVSVKWFDDNFLISGYVKE